MENKILDLLNQIRNDPSSWQRPRAGGQDNYAGMPPFLRTLDMAIKLVEDYNGLSYFSTFSDKEVEEEYERRQDLKRLKQLEDSYKDISNLNINNITAKDFQITLYIEKDYNADSDSNNNLIYRFSFNIKHGKTLYDIYYDFNVDSGKPTWWPKTTVAAGPPLWENSAFQFIPSRFCEACENSYEYEGSLQEAINTLITCGFLLTIDHKELKDIIDGFDKNSPEWTELQIDLMWNNKKREKK